jgi:hypothetical protein
MREMILPNDELYLTLAKLKKTSVCTGKLKIIYSKPCAEQGFQLSLE